MITVTVTNMNMNMVGGRTINPFISLWSLGNDPISETLQKLLISARAKEDCGLLLWCWLGSLISSSETDAWSKMSQHLVYLTLAQWSGASGAAFVDLVRLHRDGTCDKVVENGSIKVCI